MNYEQSDNVSKDTEAGQLRQAVVSGRLITVCDKCLRAACWQGLFMCDEASGAGTTDKPIEELRKLSLESEGFWAQCPPNVELTACEAGPVRPGLRLACVTRRVFLSERLLSKKASTMYHELKCWPQYFTPMEAGHKTFELRKDDRGFYVHDTLRIREWNPETERYTGREVMKEITYILEGPLMGLEAGWVILGLSHGG